MNLNLWTLAFVVACLFGTVGGASAAEEPTLRRQQYESLLQEYAQKEAAYKQAVAANPTSLVNAKLRPSVEDFGQRFLKLAQANPADAVACDSLVWVVSKTKSAENLEEAIRLLEKHHLESPKLKEIVLHLGYSESGTGLIAKLTEKGGTQDVQGLACFTSALHRYELYCALKQSDKNELAAIERLLLRVEKDYTEVRADENRTIGQLAESWLYEVQHLQPGMKAPVTEGNSVDGKKLKLSDYQGKVVLLVFWSGTCAPCLTEIPNYRKMADDFAGRPFALVGVCCGDEQKAAAKTIATEKMTWPSFLDGDLGEGKISQKWNVDGLPTVYLIDAQGIILRNRYFTLSEKDDQLLIWNAVIQAEAK